MDVSNYHIVNDWSSIMSKTNTLKGPGIREFKQVNPQFVV